MGGLKGGGGMGLGWDGGGCGDTPARHWGAAVGATGVTWTVRGVRVTLRLAFHVSKSSRSGS